MKTLDVEDGLIEEISNSLIVYDWRTESFLFSFYLNCMRELTYFRGHNAGDAFTSCVDSRQNAGRPVTPSSSKLETKNFDAVLGRPRDHISERQSWG